jgi:hypothetical protein
MVGKMEILNEGKNGNNLPINRKTDSSVEIPSPRASERYALISM